MTDPRTPDPRLDPGHPDGPRVAPHSPYSDPAADPRIVNENVVRTGESGRGGLIAAGVIAVLLVIGLIAFSSGPATDPGTTAVIPEQTQEMAPAPEAAPADPAPAVPLEEAPAAPADEAPAADQ